MVVTILLRFIQRLMNIVFKWYLLHFLSKQLHAVLSAMQLLNVKSVMENGLKDKQRTHRQILTHAHTHIAH